VYRRAGVADAPRLATFATRTFTHTYEAHNTPEDMRAYLTSAFGVEQQTREISDPAMITVLAESGRELIGYAQVRRKGAPGCVPQEAPVEIYRFYVDASAHGTGVAQGLMAETISAARELGGRHLWLGVWEKNGRGIAFYRRSGFIDVGSQFFQLGEDRQSDRVLLLSI
jgi:diamine N-acetyltransferase